MPEDKNKPKPNVHTDHYEKNAYEPKKPTKIPKIKPPNPPPSHAGN